MDAKRATQILTSLVQGIHPATGAELATDTVLQNADVIRALLTGVAALEEKAARNTRRATLPANVGNRWTAEEEQTLVQAFQAGDSLDEISNRLGRTLRAVEARLLRLGLITPEQRRTQDPFIPNS
jgi:hypothetical protein